jgi:hypothetical protein
VCTCRSLEVAGMMGWHLGYVCDMGVTVAACASDGARLLAVASILRKLHGSGGGGGLGDGLSL